MKIIFLDVDGVLINNKNGKHWNQPDSACIAQLNRITDATGAAIVLSSCWRVGRTAVECRELMTGWGVVGKVLGRTGEMAEARGYEIGAWLAAYPRPVDAFVIIDDDKDMTTFMDHLIRTDFREGLTPFNADAAITYLNR